MNAPQQIGFAEIPGWPRYRVSSDGVVWTNKLKAYGGWRPLVARPASNGYPRVSLSHLNAKRDFHVHELVLLAFVGPRPEPGHVCRHINGDPTDNRLSNLSWGTCAENEADKEAHGRRPHGSRVFGAKLTDELVREIRQRYATGEPQSSLLETFAISRPTLIRLLRGKTWAHVDLPDFDGRPCKQGKPADGEGHHFAKLTDSAVRSIRVEALAGAKSESLATKYGVSRSCIGHVLARRTWDHI